MATAPYSAPGLSVVGMVRFELTSSSPRTKRANQAALHPDVSRESLRGAEGTRTPTRRHATPMHNQLCFSPVGARGPGFSPGTPPFRAASHLGYPRARSYASRLAGPALCSRCGDIKVQLTCARIALTPRTVAGAEGLEPSCGMAGLESAAVAAVPRPSMQLCKRKPPCRDLPGGGCHAGSGELTRRPSGLPAGPWLREQRAGVPAVALGG